MRFVVRHLPLAAILIALAAVGFTACGGAQKMPASDAGSPGDEQPGSVRFPRGGAVQLPAGWQLVRKTIRGGVWPVQVLAAASYPVRLGKSPRRGCNPRRVLEQKPSDGVLVQVVEWTKRAGQPKLEGFPPRERPFRLPPGAYASHDCAGPSYNVAFRDRRRAFQAFVWLDPNRVDPRIRHQAIDLLSSMRFGSAPLDR